MTPFFGAGVAVAPARVIREHRAALIPVVVVLAINAVVLGLVVFPLSQRVAANQARADSMERAQNAATAEFRQAEGIRDGKAKASTDLETFYAKVLPADVAAARRMTHLRFQQKAREHNVHFQRGATTEEHLRDSALDRLSVLMSLSGDYNDIRALIYDLETSPDFFIIDNMTLTEGDDQSAPLTLALELSTYFRTSRTAEERTARSGR